MAAPPNVLRPLGQIETVMASLHELGGTTQTTSALRVRGPLRVALLEKAAALLQQKHPLLRAAIGATADRFYFFEPPLPPAVVIRHARPATAEYWRDELEIELNQPLEPGRALWRLALIESRDGNDPHLLLTCHHAIVDAVSLTVLFHDLLGWCDEMIAGARPVATPLPIPFALDAVLRPPRPAAGEGTPASTGPAYRRLAPLTERRTAVRFDTYGSAELDRLLDTARNAGITLNSLLAASLVRAATSVGLGRRLRVNTAVSLRGRTAAPIPADSVGCYIGVVACDLDTTGRSLVDTAADYQERMRRLLESAGHAQPAVRLGELRQRFVRLRQARAFVQGIALTNHGRLHFPSHRVFRVTGYANAACRNAGNFAVAVHATTLFDTLTLCLTYVTPLIEHERIATLATAMRRELLSPTIPENLSA